MPGFVILDSMTTALFQKELIVTTPESTPSLAEAAAQLKESAEARARAIASLSRIAEQGFAGCTERLERVQRSMLERPRMETFYHRLSD